MHSTQTKKRTGLACENCRNRKKRCNGQKPACQMCQRLQQPCHYKALKSRAAFTFKPVDVLRMASKDTIPSGASHRPAARSYDGAQSARALSGGPSSSLEEQTEQPSVVRIPFFRWFGPTGIAPGYKKFMTEVKFATGDDHEEKHSLPSETLEGDPRTANATSGCRYGPSRVASDGQLFEDADRLTPKRDILLPLLETFFDYFGSHFPFHSRQEFIQVAKEKKASAILLNSMCAMAARFSTLTIFQQQLPYLRGEAFANKAKSLLVPLLNLPSVEVVESILMIAWMEMATCHDAGLWMYTGMAVRMAEDLGMHKAGTMVDTDGEPFLYWAINFLDHIISFATGRPLTTRRENVDVRFPSYTLQTSMDGCLPLPFTGMIRIIQIQGLVNEEIGHLSEQAGDIPSDTRARLIKHGDDLVSYYTSLDARLAFDVPNFRAHAAVGQGGTFLLLHLWFNSVMISLHRPGLRFGQDDERSDNLLHHESRQVSLTAARTTASCLSLAELVDPKSILGSPFIDQAVQMAGLVFIAEIQAPPEISNPPPWSTTLGEVDGLHCQANYQVCLRTLQSLMVYWRGIGWILTAMEQRFRGLKDTDPGEFNVDPNSSVPLTDRKMIQRLLRTADLHREAETQQWPNAAAIGIAVAGTTNSQTKHSVSLLESVDRREPGRAESAQPDSSLDFSLDFLNEDLRWTSWLDETAWGAMWDPQG